MNKNISDDENEFYCDNCGSVSVDGSSKPTPITACFRCGCKKQREAGK